MSSLEAIASALPLPEPMAQPSPMAAGAGMAQRRALALPDAMTERSPTQKPVLQFLRFPVTLDPRRYAGALSNERPSGDLRALRAFRDLVDPLPGFSGYYSNQGSTEDVYCTIVNGAVAERDARLAIQVIADCRQRLADTVFTNLDGTPGQWRPVYATPGDWAEDLDADRFNEVEIDLAAEAAGDGPYAMIGGAERLILRRGGDPPSAAVPPSSQTRLGTLKMKCLFVNLHRPWFSQVLFSIAGWRLPHQMGGFCSTGSLETNRGVMPLVPMAVLLAKDIKLEADWSPTDRAFIDRGRGTNVSLGPLPLEPPTIAGALQVVAWVSALTPWSPQGQDIHPGSVLVVNRGAFSARFSVSWREQGQTETASSNVINALGNESIEFPADAVAITLKVEVMTVPPPLVAWKTIGELDWDTSARRRVELRGTLFDASMAEVRVDA